MACYLAGKMEERLFSRCKRVLLGYLSSQITIKLESLQEASGGYREVTLREGAVSASSLAMCATVLPTSFPRSQDSPESQRSQTSLPRVAFSRSSQIRWQMTPT